LKREEGRGKHKIKERRERGAKDRRGKREANNPAGGGTDFPSLLRNDIPIPALLAKADSASKSKSVSAS